MHEIIEGLANSNGNLVKAKDREKDLLEVFDNGKPFGKTTFINSLDDYLRIREGFVYCFTGYPGAGKSEFVNYLALLQAENNGLKTCFYSPENYPVEEMMETMIQSHIGKWIYQGDNRCSRDEFKEGIDFIDNHFMFFDKEDIPRIDELLNEFRLQAIAGYKIFVIDPFNAIAEGGFTDGNMSKYLRVALTQIKLFANKTKSIVFLVEHPKGVVTGSDNPPEASPYVLYGGSMWFNKMDVIVALTKMEDYRVDVKVWKVKNQKLNGTTNRDKAITLKFNWQTNRYEDLDF